MMTQRYDSSKINLGIADNLRCIFTSNWKQHFALTRRLSLDNFKVEVFEWLILRNKHESWKSVMKMSNEISKKCREEKFCLDRYGAWYCLSWIWIAWYSLCKITFHLNFTPISPHPLDPKVTRNGFKMTAFLFQKLVGSKQFSRINGLKSWKLAVVQKWTVMNRTGSPIYMRHVYPVFAFLIVHFHGPSIFSFLDRPVQSKRTV